MSGLNWSTVRLVLLASVTLGMVFGCKETVNPPVAAEADPEVVVAGMMASRQGQGSRTSESVAPNRRVVLTLNNAPSPNELFELEITQRLVELFEQRNPDIQIEFSTWRFTPESFYERAKTRTLTDIVEVTVDQMQAIIDLSLAADLTSYLANTPEVQSLNPAVLELVTREGRLFGVPVELQTMALFYNRHAFDEAFRPAPKKADTKPAKKGAETKPSKGGGEGSRADAMVDSRDAGELMPMPLVVAQARRYGGSYYDYARSPAQEEAAAQEESDEDAYVRRGEQQVENDYQVTPRPRFRWPFRVLAPQRVATPTPRVPFWRRGAVPPPEPILAPSQDESEAGDTEIESARPATSPRAGQASPDREEETVESARPQSEALVSSTAVTSVPKEEVAATIVKEEATTAVVNSDLPKNWEEFIRVAVKLTDHSRGAYGYAPILFAAEGGREFLQWCTLAGLAPSRLPNAEGLNALRSQPGLDALQFLKDLRWRYDVMPPAEKCYGDNVMKMFAEGKVAMMMLPATKDSVRRLMRLGMPPDNIGVAPLPAGPANRHHLVFGRCLIVNSQSDPAKRTAAAKWIRFMLDPEVLRLREQYLFREQDLTGIPRVPLYKKEKQAEVYTMLKGYRLLPVFSDYEEAVTTGLVPEPPRLRVQLYEDLAKDVRSALEKSESSAAAVVASLAHDFEKRYLHQVPQKPTLEEYLRLFALPQK